MSHSGEVLQVFGLPELLNPPNPNPAWLPPTDPSMWGTTCDNCFAALRIVWKDNGIEQSTKVCCDTACGKLTISVAIDSSTLMRRCKGGVKRDCTCKQNLHMRIQLIQWSVLKPVLGRLAVYPRSSVAIPFCGGADLLSSPTRGARSTERSLARQRERLRT